MDKTVKKNTSNIHEGHRERLRNRFDNDTAMESFAEHEILEFELSLVIPRKDVNELAHTLISTFGSLDSVLAATPAELKRVKNMTISAAYLLASEFAVVRRALRISDPQSRKMTFAGAESYINYIQPYFLGRHTECFSLGLLDLNFRVIRLDFTEGNLSDEINVATADILLKAARDGAKYVIIAHNHPGGSVQPSFDDIKKTKILYDALAAVHISLIDHVIFANINDMFSFHNNGLITMFAREYAREHNERFDDNPQSRHVFLYQLNEFLMEPLQGLSDHIIVHPKAQVLDGMDTKSLQNLYKKLFGAKNANE